MAKPVAITDLVIQYLKDQGLEQTILGDQLVDLWPKVMGEQVARLTGKIEIKDQMLYVQIRSAALRQQLFECRSALVRKLNEAVGATVIKDIRLR